MKINRGAGISSTALLLASLATQWIAAPAMAEPLEVGTLAPDFSLIQTDGSRFRLSDYLGKQSVYLVFWNTWCGPCVKKTPKLISIQQRLGERVKLLAINTSWSDSPEEVSAFQSRLSTNYAMAFDDEARVTRLYGVWGTPTEFIVDIHGMIRQVDDVPQTLTANLDRWNRLEAGGPLARESCLKDTLC